MHSLAITKNLTSWMFCKQFHFLTIVRLLSSFKTQDHTRAAQHVVSCMNHHIHLLLEAGKSSSNMLKSVRTKPLVWDSTASFRLTPYCSDFIDCVECDIDVKDISMLNKVIDFGITLHKFNETNMTNSSFQAFSNNYHQLMYIFLSSNISSSPWWLKLVRL